MEYKRGLDHGSADKHRLSRVGSSVPTFDEESFRGGGRGAFNREKYRGATCFLQHSGSRSILRNVKILEFLKFYKLENFDIDESKIWN